MLVSVEDVRKHFEWWHVPDCICMTVPFLNFEVNYSEDILCPTLSHIRNDYEMLPLYLHPLNGSKILSPWPKKYNTGNLQQSSE